jgi:hypothetical protein
MSSQQQSCRRLAAAGLLTGILALLPIGPALGQTPPTITLSGTTTTLPFREFATREMNDPWDMSQRTDLGWFTWGADEPMPYLTGSSVAADSNGNTYFSTRVMAGSPYPFFFNLLDTWVPGSGKLGKVGANYPIDTTVYNALYIKLKIANQVLGRAPSTQVYWTRDTPFYDPALRPGGGSITMNAGVYLTPTVSQPFGSLEGGHWVIYRIPLTIAEARAHNGSSTIDRWQNVAGGANANWGSAGVYADSLRVDAFYVPGVDVGEIQMDWARLVSYAPGSATTISWNGGGVYDIVVSTRSDCGDFAVVAYSASSGYQFQPQVLPPGVYRVGLRAPFRNTGQTTPGGNAVTSCSSGTINVQSPPTLSLTSPNVEGSSDDFATSFLSNAWDFDALTDIDYSRNISFPGANFGIVNMPATDAAGVDLGSVRVLRSQSSDVTGGIGDPHIYGLWPIPSPPAPAGTRARGLLTHVDASRYRILTVEMGVERSRVINLGSVARIVWHVAGDVRPDGNLAETVSQDIVLRHLDPATENGGRIVLDTFQADMADRRSLPIESDSPQSASGWSNVCTPSAGFGCNTSSPGYKPGVDIFRLDFHEFGPPTPSDVRRIKLAALERTGSSFQVRWTPANPSGLSATVTLKAVPEANPAGGNYRPADPACMGAGSVTIATGIPLANGAYAWTPAATPGLAGGGEYYLCAQVVVAGVSGVVDEVMSRWPVVADMVGSGPAPTLQLDRTMLRLAAISTGHGSPQISSKTQPQTVRLVQNGAGLVTWTATAVDNNGAPAPWLLVTPASGTGSGAVTVTLNDNGPFPVCTAADAYQGAIRLSSPQAANSPQYVQVLVTIYPGAGTGASAGCARPAGPSVPAFGQVDTPSQNASVVGAIAVTGWALDDVGVSGVRIYRNCLSFEDPRNCQVVAGNNVVLVGDAAFLAGARPDVEAAFSRHPASYRAGWGYLMLTNMLPHTGRGQPYGGQGSLTLFAIATDSEGNRTLLGRTQVDQTPTSITLANDSIAKPFGAIDTPGQGQTVSGALVNFGWVLTPDTNNSAGSGDILVPVDGSTMNVFIDGAPVGRVAYNQCRGDVGNPVPAGLYCNDDIGNIFGQPAPQPVMTSRTANPTLFRNLDHGRGAIGAFVIDTTALSNGLHTIAWGVSDSAGRTEGIGSRFFNVLNGAGDAAPDAPVAAADARVAPAGTLPSADPVRRLGSESDLGGLSAFAGRVSGRSSFELARAAEVVEAAADGTRYVRMPELGRLELTFDAEDLRGYLAVEGALRPLPPGSRVDRNHFTWTPGPGYLGIYRLVFVVDDGLVPVTVTIQPGGQRARITAYIDDPLSGAAVRGSFRVAGWAADLTAWSGTGIGTVHVWAQRRGAFDAAVFLGAAEMGVERPDVATAFGQQVERAGWSLTAPSLPPGTYDVSAYLWSTATGRFEDARTVTIEVK